MNKPTIKAPADERGKKHGNMHKSQIFTQCVLCMYWHALLCLRCDCAFRIRISFDLFFGCCYRCHCCCAAVVAIVDSIKYSETDDIWIDFFVLFCYCSCSRRFRKPSPGRFFRMSSACARGFPLSVVSFLFIHTDFYVCSSALFSLFLTALFFSNIN